MDMNMHIVAAVVVIASFALYAHASNQPCVLPADLGWKITGGDQNDNSAKACKAGGALLQGEECWVMPEPGYTSDVANASATSYTCPGGQGTRNPSGDTPLIQVTGCKEHYRMSAGSNSTTIVCTECEPGKTMAEMPVSSGVQETCTADCDGATAGSCAMGCGVNFYQSSGTTSSDIKCAACSPGTVSLAKPVQNNVTSCTTTTTTMQACAVPSDAANSEKIVTYVECLGSQCEDASSTWLEGLSTVPDVTCTSIAAAIQNNCSMMFSSALGLLMTNLNKSLDGAIAEAVESFTVNSVCGSSCGNNCSDGASNPSGTTDGSTDGSALVNAAPTKGPSIPFLMLAPTALLLSMCL